MGKVVPTGAMIEIDRVEVRLDAAPHPFETANADAIQANWLVESSANPALYDGRMMLHSQLTLRGRTLVGTCHAVRYATLLYWRRHAGPSSAEHAFAHAALVASDGALVAIRMGAHTAAAGRVYFASGSFEDPDFPGGMVDVDANMIREVREETGLDLGGLRRDATYRLSSGPAGTVIFRRFHLEAPAEAVAERIAAFVASETEPEITGPVIIRSADERPEGLAGHMIPFIAWHFGGG